MILIVSDYSLLRLKNKNHLNILSMKENPTIYTILPINHLCHTRMVSSQNNNKNNDIVASNTIIHLEKKDNVLARMLDHKEAIISHLSWASLFLGFHTLGFMFIMMSCLLLVLRKNQFGLNLYLPNGYNLLMVKLHMGSIYFYLQRTVQRSMRVEAYGCRVG